MDENTKDKDQESGGSGIIWLLLLIGGLWLWNKNKNQPEAKVDDTSGGGSGGDGVYGGGEGDGGYIESIIEDAAFETVVADTNGSGASGSGGSTPPIKQAMTARTLDPEWQAQKSRINMALLPDYQKKQIEKGAVTKNTLQSIADYQQVKAGTMSAFDYANDPNMPEEMRAGIEYSSTAYQTSPTTVRNRALAYYSGQTGAHRGGMSAEERAAWDSTNEKAALEAYANAAGSGNQAAVARQMAANLPGASLSNTPAANVTKTAIVDNSSQSSQFIDPNAAAKNDEAALRAWAVMTEVNRNNMSSSERQAWDRENINTARLSWNQNHNTVSANTATVSKVTAQPGSKAAKSVGVSSAAGQGYATSASQLTGLTHVAPAAAKTTTTAKAATAATKTTSATKAKTTASKSSSKGSSKK